MSSQQRNSAEEWLAFLLGGDVTSEDWQQLQNWLAEKAENRQQFELLHHGWQVAGVLADDPSLPLVASSLPSLAAERRVAWRRPGLAVAATLLLVIGAVMLFFNHGRVVQHQTDHGRQRMVLLADGTKIHLNTATTVDVAANERHIQLLAGEAFFDVRERADPSFVVQAGAHEVRVLGTRFNMLRVGPDLLVSVLEGQVAVDVLNPADGQLKPYLLAAGQTLEVRHDSAPQRYVGSADLERILAWRDGKIEFNRTALSDAVHELNRYLPKALSITEPSLAQMRVSGIFRIDLLADMSSIQFALESSLPVKVRPADQGLEIVSAQR